MLITGIQKKIFPDLARDFLRKNSPGFLRTAVRNIAFFIWAFSFLQEKKNVWHSRLSETDISVFRRPPPTGRLFVNLFVFWREKKYNKIPFQGAPNAIAGYISLSRYSEGLSSSADKNIYIYITHFVVSYKIFELCVPSEIFFVA